MGEKSCELVAGELEPLEDLGAAILRDRLPHCVEAEVRGQGIEDSPRQHSARSPDAWECRGGFKFYVQRVKDGAGAHDFLRRRKAEACFRACVQAMDGGVQLALGIPGPVRLLGQVLAQQASGILVGPAKSILMPDPKTWYGVWEFGR